MDIDEDYNPPMLNKLCTATFIFTTINEYESSAAAGWKAAQVKELSIGM